MPAAFARPRSRAPRGSETGPLVLGGRLRAHRGSLFKRDCRQGTDWNAAFQRVREKRFNGSADAALPHLGETVPRPDTAMTSRGAVSWQGRARGRTPF